ncbi:MAG: PQQ-binding-like beta-propeller repeat protein, partial [Myxococcales bacterium]|nr:PQQ-binding-like beta-propeller repeat protein [Myxococcales bacterium]
VDDGLLVVNVGAPDGPCVAAFDKITGRMRWGVGNEWGPSYASPVASDVHGRRKVFVFAGGESRPPTGGLLMVDAATGKLDFSFPWRSRSYESVNAATPVVVGNEVLISATYRTGAALLRVAPDFSFEKAWESSELDLHWTTAIEEDGYFYAFAGRNEPDAVLRCVERKTGRTVWSEVLEWDETVEMNGRKRAISASPFRGSLLKIDGRWLALGEFGHLLWLDLSTDGVKMDSKTSLFFARETWSPPVVSRGLLYVSQNTKSFDAGKPPRLLCYDLRA